jgi:hypothetical protein
MVLIPGKRNSRKQIGKKKFPFWACLGKPDLPQTGAIAKVARIRHYTLLIDNPEDRDWKRCGKSNDAGATSVMRLNHETIIRCPGNPP